MSKIEGGCLCGSVRYSSETQPIVTANCHCKNCQKQGGAAFSVNIGMPKAGLEITGDSLTVYEDVGDSGNAVNRNFCNKCGSPIYSELVTAPDLVFIKAGTLDDTSSIQPQMNVWCKSAQSWVQFDENVPKFDTNP